MKILKNVLDQNPTKTENYLMEDLNAITTNIIKSKGTAFTLFFLNLIL